MSLSKMLQTLMHALASARRPDFICNADLCPQRAAYATAWNSVKTGTSCSCDVDIYASADATVSGWAEIWAGIYASLDNAACAGTGAQHFHNSFVVFGR